MPCASCASSRTKLRRSQRTAVKKAPASATSSSPAECRKRSLSGRQCTASAQACQAGSPSDNEGATQSSFSSSFYMTGPSEINTMQQSEGPVVLTDLFYSPPYDLRQRSLSQHFSSLNSAFQPPRKRTRRVQSSIGSVKAQRNAPISHHLLHTLPDDVILTIFSYLTEKDLCRMSQVCKRFLIMADDLELWRKLYQSLYEYDMPLFHPEPCRFEFERVADSDLANPWKESFRQLYRGLHVKPGYQDLASRDRQIRFFNTIESALDFVDKNGDSLTAENGDGPLVFIHAGTYTEEFIVIDCDISLIGAAPGIVSQSVILDRSSESTLMFVEGAKRAYAGFMTLKFSPGIGLTTPHHKHCSLEISENCSPVIDSCLIWSSSVVGGAVCVSGMRANPTIRRCNISHCANVGVCITDFAQGLYEENEICNNFLAGILVKNGASPIMRRNHIHHCRDVGVLTFDNGMGYFENNDIHSNCNAGIEVKTGANPTVVNCEIHHGHKYGVYVHGSGRGQFMYNKIHSFNFAGVWITSYSNPTVRRNEIYNCRQGGVYIYEGRALIEYNNIYEDALPGIQITSSGHPIIRHNNIYRNC